MQEFNSNPEYSEVVSVNDAIAISPEKEAALLTLTYREKNANALSANIGKWNQLIEILKDAYRVGYEDGKASIE